MGGAEATPRATRRGRRSAVELSDITNLDVDGIPTPFETATLDVTDDGWTLTVVGVFEIYGIPDKVGETVPVSIDDGTGRRGGVASIESVEHEEHTAERTVVRLVGTRPLR